MRERSLTGALLLLAVFGSGPLAAERIEATVDRTEATLADQIVLTVVIEGSRSARPELPELPDFDVRPAGQSTQFSFVNGRSTSSVSYRFLLLPRRVGTFEIPPITVELDGKVLVSRSFRIRIAESPGELGQEQQDLFISARVSTTEPFVGQQVVYTWRFYRRVRIGDARLEAQQFDGFLVEDLGEVREYQAAVEGRQYLVSEFRKALFPQEEGTLVVPASQLVCQVIFQDARRGLFDDMFGRATAETRVLRSPPIELQVRPLPAPPSDFSGLVGSFDLEASVSKRALRVGESTTLRVTVSGTGNAQMIAEPPLPPLPSFKIYDDKPDGSLRRDGRLLGGSKTFSKALVPLVSGELAVPPLALTYFDPEAATYRTARAPALALQVSPAEGREELRLTESLTPTAGKVAVKIFADDILPIDRAGDPVAGGIAWASARVLLTGIAAPPAVFAALLLVQRRRRRHALDSGLARRQAAWRRARRSLRRLRSAAAGDGTAAERASRCVREYIGDKLGLEGAALTPREAGQHLRAGGVADSLAAEAERLLERLDAVRYGAAAQPARQVADEIAPLLRRLERQIGR